MNSIASFINKSGHRLLVFLFLSGLSIGCGTKEPSSAPTADVSDPTGPNMTDTRGNLTRLQGRWQSNDDPASVNEIDGDRIIFWYDGAVLSTATITLVNNCQDQTDNPVGAYFTATDDSGTSCYYIVHLDESELEYAYVARGNMLSYTKID